MADHPRAENSNAANGGADKSQNAGDLASTTGGKLASADGAFVVSLANGKLGDLLPPTAQAFQAARSALAAMQPNAGQVHPAQVLCENATSMTPPTHPKTRTPDALSSLARASQTLPSIEPQGGLTEAKPSVTNEDADRDDESQASSRDSSKASSKRKAKMDRSKLRKGKWTVSRQPNDLLTSCLLHRPSLSPLLHHSPKKKSTLLE